MFNNAKRFYFAEFRTLILDIQAGYSDEKAKAIDQKIFDLYGLTPEEREAIGYISRWS